MRNAEKDAAEIAKRRDAVLREGFRLFSEKGIEYISMQDVARTCGLGVATLYRYYNTKLDLVMAVSIRQWEDYCRFITEKYELQNVKDMTAAEEMVFYLDFFSDLYLNHKDMLRFNKDFNNYVKHGGVTETQLNDYFNSVNLFGGLVDSIYEKGLRDGTVRTDLSPEQMYAVTCHIMFAVVSYFADSLLFLSQNEENRRSEFELLKQMILREFQPA